MYCAKGMAALKDNLEHICAETIQACILVGNNCFGDGDADAESLYFGAHFFLEVISRVSDDVSGV